MLVSHGPEVAGVIAVSDRPRDELYRLQGALTDAEVRKTALLTGDASVAGSIIGSSTGIDEIHRGLLPDDKLVWIRAAQGRGEVVAMVGDGINDALALAAADVSDAMAAAGGDIALETADVALMADDLVRILEALHISRSTVRIIRQNLAISLATVCVLLAGLLVGQVNMAGGMLVREVSVLVEIANGMRLMQG